jgi:hypothetical protein
MSDESKFEAAKASHDAIDKAICQHISDLGIEGLTTGWTIVASIASVEGDHELDGMYSSQSNGLSKWALVGLLTVALESAKTEGLYADE